VQFAILLIGIYSDIMEFQGAWLLLSEIVAFLPKFDSSFILQYWQNGVSCAGMT